MRGTIVYAVVIHRHYHSHGGPQFTRPDHGLPCVPMVYAAVMVYAAAVPCADVVHEYSHLHRAPWPTRVTMAYAAALA